VQSCSDERRLVGQVRMQLWHQKRQNKQLHGKKGKTNEKGWESVTYLFGYLLEEIACS